MNLSTMSLPEIALLIVIVVALCFAIYKVVKQKASTIKSADDFIEFVTTDLKDRVVNIITTIAFEQELEGSLDYDEFKDKCTDKVTAKVLEYINENLDKIPTQLAPYITDKNIRAAVVKIMEITDADKILGKVYDDKVKRFFDMQKEEEEKAAKLNAETGVEDEKLLEKDPVPTEDDSVDEDNHVDITEEIIK